MNIKAAAFTVTKMINYNSNGVARALKKLRTDQAMILFKMGTGIKCYCKGCLVFDALY